MHAIVTRASALRSLIIDTSGDEPARAHAQPERHVYRYVRASTSDEDG